MGYHFFKNKEEAVKRYYGIVIAFAIVSLVAGGLFLALKYESVTEYVAVSVSVPEPEIKVETLESLFARSAPTVLSIPKINLQAEFVAPLDLNDDGTVSVPDDYSRVGWYKYGATPGEVGPTVILGHVDSKEGPAVFYSLGQLKEGDEVSVTREDGTIATFAVDELRRYNQDNFPTEKVYGQIDYAGLRLVTCTGLYDRKSQRYSHNLVVYATLKDELIDTESSSTVEAVSE